MYAIIKLLNGFQQPLLYHLPSQFSAVETGTLVRVPLRNREESGVITALCTHRPAWATYDVKDIIGLEKIPSDIQFIRFIERVSAYYQLDRVKILARIHTYLSAKHNLDGIVPQNTENSLHTQITLTSEQQAVADYIISATNAPQYAPTLLHGVTGSGKTEVYKKIIEHTIGTQKTALLLLPEVTLALQFEQLLRAQLPAHILIVSFHSGTTAKQKKLVWQQLLQKKPLLIIGVHMPILLPISNLGYIIVDEEHEVGYQEKKAPYMNSKEVALLRAQTYNIPILLGSATPSMHSLYQVHNGAWKQFSIHKRFSGAFPTVKCVSLTEDKNRRDFWLSNELVQEIAERLAKKEQAIIFINRRGYSFFAQCKQCATIISCQNCSVSLTVHENNILSCHYCGHTKQLPPHCESCSSTSPLMTKGIGTQQIAALLKKRFPQARIGRADLDVTARKKEWQKTVEQFSAGELDILVGTQTITKGYHFPRVTLVGIIWADLNLHFPRYNASETTVQQLIQVAGRAGRASENSTVIVQHMAQHDIFSYLSEVKYPELYDYEISRRSLLHYPPCGRLALIELKHSNPTLLDQETAQVARVLQNIITEKSLNITLLGPVKPPVHMIKQVHTRLIYCKSARMEAIISLYAQLEKDVFSSLIAFVPNPLH